MVRGAGVYSCVSFHAISTFHAALLICHLVTVFKLLHSTPRATASSLTTSSSIYSPHSNLETLAEPATTYQPPSNEGGQGNHGQKKLLIAETPQNIERSSRKRWVESKVLTDRLKEDLNHDIGNIYSEEETTLDPIIDNSKEHVSQSCDVRHLDFDEEDLPLIRTSLEYRRTDGTRKKSYGGVRAFFVTVIHSRAP